MVTRPAVPPYSSSTIAMCTLRRWRLWSRSSIEHRLGHEQRRADQRCAWAAVVLALEVRQQVLGVEDAHDVVHGSS